MTVAVTPTKYGAPLKAGTRLAPSIGGVGLWSHVYSAATLRGVVTSGSTMPASSTLPDCLGSYPLTASGNVRFEDGDDPAIVIDTTSAGTGSLLASSVPVVTAWTAMIVVSATARVANTFQVPGLSANAGGPWIVFATANVTTTAGATAKAVHIFRRQGDVLSIWVNGVKAWESTLSWGTLTTASLGFKPTRVGVDATTRYHHMRYTPKALTDEQIAAASADARTLHGV